ncbi:hypothetical protein ETAE_1063 [Edwardsiella piscicida]|uniref:Uncharacterized protein n=1 Tax=Edwardsiella piscicida TaxID=1263550 RepID=A0AAU8P264_EDWPI|nr:hypothetical protein ETAE_1063 [Edwardsiella tarda EIB202]
MRCLYGYILIIIGSMVKIQSSSVYVKIGYFDKNNAAAYH